MGFSRRETGVSCYALLQEIFPTQGSNLVSCTAGIFFTIIIIYISHFLFAFYINKIQPVNPKGNQFWIFTGRTDAEAEASTLWPPDAKNRLTGKDPDAGKDWRREEKGKTRWNGWMASPTWRIWVRVGSRSWWWTKKPGLLQLMGSQRVRHDWGTELNYSHSTIYWTVMS